MTTYSTVDDFLIENIPLPRTLNAQKFVNDAADEIDSVIGARYATPINMLESGPVLRHSRLLIRRVSVALSTGRMILALATPGEDGSLHAYGARLVRDALSLLEGIRVGDILLEGAETTDSFGQDGTMSIVNHDPTSIVDTFESAFMGGAGGGQVSGPVWRPGGLG